MDLEKKENILRISDDSDLDEEIRCFLSLNDEELDSYFEALKLEFEYSKD